MTSSRRRAIGGLKAGLLRGVAALGLICALTLAAGAAAASGPTWSEPLLLSDPQTAPNGSFPELAVDAAGRVHTTWYVAIKESGAHEEGTLDLLAYRSAAGGTWSESRSIFASSDRPPPAEAMAQGGDLANVSDAQYMIHSALAAGRDGQLHLAFGSNVRLGYLGAPTDSVAQVMARRAPQELGSGSFTALASTAEGALHLTFNQKLVEEPRPNVFVCQACTEIIYRRSADGGANWSPSLNLSNMPGDDGQQQLRAGRPGELHLIWEHTPDIEAGDTGPSTVIYRRSLNGGERWEELTTLGIAGESVRQAAMEALPDGQVMVVYRSIKGDLVYFQRSTDGGTSWSVPGYIPTVRARLIDDTRYDRYSLAADSAGRLHLLMAGFEPGDTSRVPKLLHLTWDGQSWSAPGVVMAGGAYPEAPRLAVERGNRLHAVWFTREGTLAPDTNRQSVWYSAALTDAPDIAPPPVFTPQPSPTAPQPTATIVIVPTPIGEVSRTAPALDAPPSWEGQGLRTLAMALAPVVILVAVVAGVIALRQQEDPE